MLVKKLTGKEVIGAHGEKIGRVADFDIDLLSGRVKSVLISAGFNKTYKIKTDDIITAGDTVIIRLSESDLKQAAARKGK